MFLSLKLIKKRKREARKRTHQVWAAMAFFDFPAEPQAEDREWESLTFPALQSYGKKPGRPAVPEKRCGGAGGKY